MTTTAEVRAPAPMTAAGLSALVEQFGPAVESGALVFDRDPPANLGAVLEVLHTGLRAVLTRRQWWGSSTAGTKRPRVAVLDPNEPLPRWVALVCVAGDTCWDRIHPAAYLDLPHLFATN